MPLRKALEPLKRYLEEMIAREIKSRAPSFETSASELRELSKMCLNNKDGEEFNKLLKRLKKLEEVDLYFDESLFSQNSEAIEALGQFMETAAELIFKFKI